MELGFRLGSGFGFGFGLGLGAMAGGSKSSSTRSNLANPNPDPDPNPDPNPNLLEELLDALEGEVLATQQRQHLAELVRVERALPVDVGKG